MNKEELTTFCTEWLEAWTGNDPDALISYYDENALYSDPAHRAGLKGKDEIRRYFIKLLDVYRYWKWTPVEIFPISSGAIVKWTCEIPVGPEVIHEIGLDIVEITNKKITRNEVFFDRTRLVASVEKRRRDQRLINL
ncbi:nuclear transport factor 2 family protein [Candidatus Thorarchaeota archaeon]|nr:MAG: nuclear transport factor 2 family protein [Candidatus Thorarchaeota archaeon]